MILLSHQIGLRRFWTGDLYLKRPTWARCVLSSAVVLAMAVFTAFMETWTISSVRLPFTHQTEPTINPFHHQSASVVLASIKLRCLHAHAVIHRTDSSLLWCPACFVLGSSRTT